MKEETDHHTIILTALLLNFYRLSTLEFARNKARIYSCNLIMILATAGCISYVAFKKYEANRMELEQRTEEEFIRRINSQI